MAIDGPNDNPWLQSQQPRNWADVDDGGFGGGPVNIDRNTPGAFGPGIDGNTGGGPIGGGGGDTGGGAGMWDWIKKLFPGGQDGGFGFGGINPNMIPFLATAMNQYNNSGKYMDMATKYADKMNPFGDQRDFYKDRLRRLTEDPNAYLSSSPDYKAALTQGIGALDSSMSAKGFSGAGHAADEAQRYGSTLAAQFLDKDRQSLMKMAGADIGPAAAAALISQGLKGSIDSQNNALGSLAAAFSKPDPRDGGKNPDGSPKVPRDVQDIINDAVRRTGAGGTSPAAFASMVQQLVQRGYSPQQAMQFIRDGMAGGDRADYPGQGTGGGLVDTGDGWYDPDTGRYMDYDGNLIGNVGGPGEPGDAGGGGDGPIQDIPYDVNPGDFSMDGNLDWLLGGDGYVGE